MSSNLTYALGPSILRSTKRKIWVALMVKTIDHTDDRKCLKYWKFVPAADVPWKKRSATLITLKTAVSLILIMISFPVAGKMLRITCGNTTLIMVANGSYRWLELLQIDHHLQQRSHHERSQTCRHRY